MGIMRHFKSYFLRGLAVLLPTILTIWIFIWGYNFIQNNISIWINRGIVQLVMLFEGDDQQVTKEALYQFWVTGSGSIAGFVLAVVAVCIVGAMLANVAGKTLWHVIERFILRAPFIKDVYPYIKQITDFLLTEHRFSFSRVVAFEYPRKGSWALGFVTGNGLNKISEKTGKEMVTIFLPTSPTPFTGFVMMVPRADTIDVQISIEEALRFTISGGVITPGTNIKIDKDSTLAEVEAEVKKEEK